MSFSHEELARYSRHLILPEFNIEGQRKLKKSRVLVVGAGGLGCPILMYLAAAGVGTIGIIDFDVVDQSNLQRQVLFSEDDLGKPKAETAAQKLTRQNPHIHFKVHNTKLTAENALEIMEQYDLVADGTDNFPARYLINDACILLKKTNVHASIFRFEGQVSVFNYQYKDGSVGPQYRDIFPEPPPPALVTSCAEGGVLGVLPGIIGSFQANEIIKILAEIGEPLAGRLLIFDALSFESRIMKIRKNPDLEPITELIDYELYCGMKDVNARKFQEVSARELHELMQENSIDYQILDVRELHEFQLGNIGGLHIPLKDLEARLREIDPYKKSIVLCRSGVRSRRAIEKMQHLGFSNLYNLHGGLLEWAKNVDDSLII